MRLPVPPMPSRSIPSGSASSCDWLTRSRSSTAAPCSRSRPFPCRTATNGPVWPSTKFLGYLWVPSWSGTVTLIAAGGTPRNAATFPVGLNPGPVAVDRRTHYAWVVSMGREVLHDDILGETWVMDPNASGPRARIPAGGFPMSLTVNAAANRAYVAVRNPNPAGSSFVQDRRGLRARTDLFFRRHPSVQCWPVGQPSVSNRRSPCRRPCSRVR